MASAESVIVLAQHKSDRGMGRWGMCVPQAVQAANERRVALLSNKLLDARVMDREVWKSEGNTYPVWSGTLVAYDFWDNFGKEVVYKDPETKERYVFPVKPDFKGERGLLAVEHGFIGGKPIFEIKQDGRDLRVVISDSANVILETRFPAQWGWYATNELGIPIGERVDERNPRARYLSRAEKHIGLVARGFHLACYGRPEVDLFARPSLHFGALAQKPAKQAP